MEHYDTGRTAGRPLAVGDGFSSTSAAQAGPKWPEGDPEYWIDLATQRGIAEEREKREREAAAAARAALAPAVEAVDAGDAARICGVSRTLWYDLKKAGRVPLPVRLGRRTLWRVEELKRWLAADCPPLHRWQQMNRKAAR